MPPGRLVRRVGVPSCCPPRPAAVKLAGAATGGVGFGRLVVWVLVGVVDVALCLGVGEADVPGEGEAELLFCAGGEGDGGCGLVG